jgi:hypothetical protein
MQTLFAVALSHVSADNLPEGRDRTLKVALLESNWGGGAAQMKEWL